jgi:hypothetical protein
MVDPSIVYLPKLKALADNICAAAIDSSVVVRRRVEV